MKKISVLGVPISALSWEATIDQIFEWSKNRESRYVCICNAHSVVTATRDESFANTIVSADLATPDGAPVAWMMRRLGVEGQERINGPDLMWRYCAEAAQRGEAVYLYGASPSTLERLCQRLTSELPGLRLAGAYSPPFRSMTPEEEMEIVERINRSGAGVVWVGLGCPKQENWMARHRGKIKGVMIGVGAAFDYHAGTLSRAPTWMRNLGLEWLHRLLSEPKRLWRRYTVTNTLFIIGAAKQLFHK